MSSYQQTKYQFFHEIEQLSILTKDKQDIFDAFSFGESKHGDQKRKQSNEPYFIHCTQVALSVISEVDVEKDFVIAALLHDTVEDTDVTLDDLQEKFGPTVEIIVQGLTKLPDEYKKEWGPERYYQEGFFGLILKAAQKQPFIWKNKLADRLNNLQTLWEYASNAKKEEYLWETQQILKLSIGVKTPLKDMIREVLKEHYI